MMEIIENEGGSSGGRGRVRVNGGFSGESGDYNFIFGSFSSGLNFIFSGFGGGFSASNSKSSHLAAVEGK